MTVEALYQLALSRRPMERFCVSRAALKRFLEDCVGRGWLVKERGRYFLTADGATIARALGGDPAERLAA